MNTLIFRSKWVYLLIAVSIALIGYYYYSSGPSQKSETVSPLLHNQNIKIEEMKSENSGALKNQSSFGEPAWNKSVGNRFVPSSNQSENIDTAQSKPKSEKKYEDLMKIQSKLNALSPEKMKDPEEVAKILQELEQVNGSPIMNGLRLDVLRENLQTVSRMTPIAKKLEEIEKSNIKGNEKLESEKNQLRQQLQELSKKIRTDVADNSIKNKGSN